MPGPHPFPKVPPYQRGRVVTLDHVSQALRDNPWDDPCHRDIEVYLPPGYGTETSRHYPVLMLLSGFAGKGSDMLATGLTRMSLATRIDRLLASGACGPFVAVLPDCMSRLGGSQHVDSAAIGSYASYLVHELRPFIDGRFRTTGRWGVAGGSSGGFGALHLAGRFPGAFEAVASHAGDLGFDLCYLGDVHAAVAPLRAAGGPMAFVRGVWEKGSLGGGSFPALNMLCMAAAYAPAGSEPGPDGFPAPLPVDLETGAVDFGLIEAWRAFDPIVEVELGTTTEALAALSLLFVDAGDKDEYYLQLGARRFSAALEDARVPHHFELFEGSHRGLSHRFDRSLPLLVEALGGGSGGGA